MFFLSPPTPPQTENKYPKKGRELFSFLEIFTAEFSHFLVTKTKFFCHKKWLNSAVKISKNEKSSPLFWGGIKTKFPLVLIVIAQPIFIQF